MKTSTKAMAVVLASGIIFSACGTEKTEEEVPTTETSVVETAEKVAMVATGEYMVDTEKTVVTWAGDKAVGSGHNGALPTSGSVTLQDGIFESGTFVFDIANMTVTDIQGDSAQGLIDHLAIPEFFNTEAFPTATFVFESATETEMTGSLTIKDTTKEITFPYEVTQTESEIVATGDIILDRNDFDLKLETLKDAMLKDEIAITMNVVLSQ